MRTKYFLLHDKKCVWRWKFGEMTFVDLRSFSDRRGNKRRETMDEPNDLKKSFKITQITYKQARKLNPIFVK